MNKYYEYIGQAIGIVAMIIIALSYQQKTHNKIMIFQIISGSLFTLHFALIGAFTGSILNLIGALRCVVYSNRDKKWTKSNLWPAAFAVAFLISGILTWENIFSVFPIIAMILSTIILWIKNPKINRIFSLPSSACWITYNIKNLSYAGIATEIFVIISIIIGIIRFDIPKKVKHK